MTGSRPLLEAVSLSKRFCRNTRRSLHYALADLAGEFLPGERGKPALRKDEFWALDDASFTINAGEAVAIGGRNGAGKTTLLRVLAGLLKPDGGHLAVSGTVNPVIELGQGLNLMLTGRENAEIGLAWRGADNVGSIEAVAEFAELGAMFDAPVHSYSAGMQVRLAYAIAAAVPCDLLLLDEVLAVGDVAFQRKCFANLRQHLDAGGALILVSHNPVQMQALCRRGILLDHGKLVFDGSIEDCIDTMFALQADATPQTHQSAGEGLASIAAVKFESAGDGAALSGAETTIVMEFVVRQPVRVACSLGIWTRDGSCCISTFTEPEAILYQPGSYRQSCRIPALPLSHGTYQVRATLLDSETMISIARWGYNTSPSELKVEEPVTRLNLLTRHIGQIVAIDHEWSQPETAPGGA
ncbi:ABC transporter ATP-binding protein [Novosphingobium sp. TH158]|uniref:ABC transporter ATP-binding protein n=1 Tax=Novosphingobium sp. TH158 TaxID=2067455 RepID=UPI000C7B143E|nr:ABC transporter ATP-binding protein [Novosphingobium sp. TH158]PLK26768.1 ABC transporter ATP-binding protein [Novosphingobium sp. TH158]